MRHVVSYSYFRHKASVYEKEKGNAALQFEQFLPMLLRGHHTIWAGWELHIHHDEEVTRLPYWPVMQRAAKAGLVELRYRGEATSLCGAMLWRADSMRDCVGFVACRDVDSLPSRRDRFLVERFILSGLGLHVIHDNPSHIGIMGGTMAAFAPWVYPHLVTALALHSLDLNKHGADQVLLNQRVAPAMDGSILVHSSIGRKPGLAKAHFKEITEPREEYDLGIGVCDWPHAARAWIEKTYAGDPVLEQINALELG